MSDNDLDAMLKSLMSEDTEDGWTLDEDFLTNVESLPLGEEEEVFVSEDELEEIAAHSYDAAEEEEVVHKKHELKFLKAINLKDLKRTQPKDFKLIRALIWSAVLVAIAVGAFAIFVFNRIPDPYAIYLEQPAPDFNTAAHSFVNISFELGENERGYSEELFLSRILLDEAATIFYFHDILDEERFVFAMEDTISGRVYNRDITYAGDPSRQSIREQTAIRFEPLSREGSRFTFIVTDLKTGRVIETPLAYNGLLNSAGRHFYKPVEFENIPMQGLSIQLSNAVFSAAGSTVNLSITTDFGDDSAGQITMLQGLNAPPAISLRHRGSVVPAVRGSLQAASFGGDGSGVGSGSSDSGGKRTTLIRMDFSPVRSLGGNLEIALDGLYRYYTVNRVISAGSLLGTRGANVPIELSGNHTVFVEGMAFQGNYVVVPLHGIHFSEELELEFDEDGEEVASPAETVPKFTETRVATAITATLFGTDSNGQEQSLTGRAYYDFRGTDLIFDTRENADFMDIPHSRLQLRIETVAVRLPRLTLGLSLNYASVLPSVERNEIITAITDHFASRGGVAQVAAMSQTDNQIYAIVIEQHQAISGGRLQRSAGTYHITAELLANGTVQVTSMTNAQRR